MDHRFPLFIVDCTCTEFYVFIGTIFHFIVGVSITVFNPTTLVSVSIYHFNHFRPNILSSFKYFLRKSVLHPLSVYVHVYTYQYRKSMIHPLCSCLHLPIQEICAPSFMFMFTLTNTGNL
jgi:hypothetical protein